MELFFFFFGQDVDHVFHFAGFQIGHLEDFFEKQIRINQAGPRKQVDQSVEKRSQCRVLHPSRSKMDE